ncbi:MAG: hypothetical protein DRZ76_01580 [Candidatus Nealsonbacteria bacterium]|nr:MAG: hypothetical protein DRZ76_01580 [Candidatus Nealsonbacteria bacterium]
MPFHFPPINFLQYLLKRESEQFFVSIAIRSLALGMILIFEPVYLYLYFNYSLPLTLLFFGAVHMLFGVLAVYGGKAMAKFGLKRVMLFSHFFFFGYYLCLFFLYQSFLLVPLAIILKGFGMILFWPAFHVDFCRFSERNHQGREVGKMNVAILIPTIISPMIGGWILAGLGYPALFVAVLVVLFASSIPMFLSKEVHVIYSDSYRMAWRRILRKANKRINWGIIANSIEMGVNSYCWPLFMAILAIGYGTMGGITTFALGMAVLFTLYIGRMSDKIINRVKLLNLGSFLTSIAWILKYFVTTPFTAFLAQTLYRICRTTAGVPHQTLLYERASLKGAETDEFIIYRETIFNVSRGVFFIFLALLFLVIPKINIAFILAAVVSLGMTFLGVPPKAIRNLKWIREMKNHGLSIISKNK